MKYLLFVIAFLLTGCFVEQPEVPSQPNTVKIKQRCLEDSNVTRPDFLAEEGDNVQYTQAVFTNKERCMSYVYDLEAERAKCR